MASAMAILSHEAPRTCAPTLFVVPSTRLEGSQKPLQKAQFRPSGSEPGSSCPSEAHENRLVLIVPVTADNLGKLKRYLVNIVHTCVFAPGLLLLPKKPRADGGKFDGRLCDYALTLVAHSWLSEIQDLIDPGRIHLGLVRRNGEIVEGWSTIHEYRPPPLLATEGSTKTCPTCGYAYTVLHGREFFSDEAVLGRPLILNSNGIFVREDLARARNLRTPRGAFEPGLIEFETGGQ